MPAAAELEIFMVLRQRVAVQHDMRLAAVARRAGEQLMLAAFAEFPEIGERAVRRRHAGIILLDPSAHLLDQLLLQAVGMAEQALGVAVLGFEIGPDIRIEDQGIAQHLLPFRILDPRIVVGHRDAVGGEGMRPARRNGGRWLGRLGHKILMVRGSALYRDECGDCQMVRPSARTRTGRPTRSAASRPHCRRTSGSGSPPAPREGDHQHRDAEHRDRSEVAAFVEIEDQDRQHLGL